MSPVVAQSLPCWGARRANERRRLSRLRLFFSPPRLNGTCGRANIGRFPCYTGKQPALFDRSLSLIRSLFVGVAIVGVYAAVCVGVDARSSAPPASARFSTTLWRTVELGTIDPAVFDLALGAVACAVRSGSIDNPSTLTVIDYSRPSTAKRLWVFDLHTPALLYEELVAHGKGSGENLATRFSNELDSHQSSLGLFLTEDTYVGKNGYSLRLRGLDRGFNDRAYERAIVMHGAPYVDGAVAKKQGRLGRSWGCPALREAVARDVIDTIRGGGVIFSYYPDDAWLKRSRFINCANGTGRSSRSDRSDRSDRSSRGLTSLADVRE